MSVQGLEENEEVRHSTGNSISLSISRRVFVGCPGDVLTASISVDSSTRRVIRLSAENIPGEVAEVVITPQSSVTPLSSTMYVSVSQNALPGVYPFVLKVVDEGIGGTVCKENLALVVAPRKDAVENWKKHVELWRSMYARWGPSRALYLFLFSRYLYLRAPTSLGLAYEFHHMIASTKSKNATLKILQRLAGYGVIRKVCDGVYIPVAAPDVAFNAIDGSRVRLRNQVVGTNSRNSFQDADSEVSRVPRAVAAIISTAKRLVEEGKKWIAVDLLAHTLLPVRRTGVLLARRGDVFVFYERKTRKMHMLRSPSLAEIFRGLGIGNSFLGLHRLHEADNIIRELFSSHENARRIHYQLKELGWFHYPQEHYFYKFEFYPKPRLLIIRMTGNKLETFAEIVLSDTDVKILEELGIPPKGPVVAKEHVKMENEETYHYRPRNLIRG